MTAASRRPWFPPLVILFVLGCSSGSSSSGSSGCGSSSSTATCDIDATSTICGTQITLECHDSAKPDEKSACQVALTQGTESIYCCASKAKGTSAAAESDIELRTDAESAADAESASDAAPGSDLEPGSDSDPGPDSASGAGGASGGNSGS